MKAMQNAGGGGEQVTEGAAMTKDGKSATSGENPFGPKRSESDKKIAEIKANTALSEELKKQLIDEVERTYQEAQAGMKKQ
jgi:hypothetical protein